MKTTQDNSNVVMSREPELFKSLKTGEIVEADRYFKRVYGSKQFWKVYLADFLTMLGIIESKQLDALLYVLENTNPATNLFIGSLSKIAKDSGVGKSTVQRLFNKLQEIGRIKPVQRGVWMVDPDLLMKGGEPKRQILLTYYRADEPIDEITKNRRKQIPQNTVADGENFDGQQRIDEKGEQQEERNE